MLKRGMWLIVLILVISSTLAVTIDQEVLDALEDNSEVSVIVVLKDQPVLERGLGIASANADEFSRRKEMIREVQDEVFSELRVRERRDVDGSGIASAEEYDFELRHRYSIINGFSGKVTKEGLERLIASGQVEKVEFDHQMKILLSQSVPQVNADDVWNITVNGNSINGSGETVCVIDTGIDYTHPALGGCTNTSFLNGSCSKVIGGYDYCADDTACLTEDSDPRDVHGHGTHVSGIVASENNTYRGVAPGAKIVSIKVMNSSGSGSFSDINSGIDWCVNNATLFNISVISISLGGFQFSSYCDSTYTSTATAINNAINKNISVVIATGNTGPGYTNATAGISAPACVQNVTRVSAVDKSDTMASYAFRHSYFLDILVAPGGSANDCTNGICSANNGGGFIGMKGTSMAAPHVSGAAALLQQYNRQVHGQALTPTEIRQKLNSTGVTISDAGGSGLNFSRINVYAAILSLDNVTPTINFTFPTPANGSIYNGTVTINISSSETLQNATLEWNGTNESMSGANINFYKTKSGISGNYTFKVYGIDLANNSNSTEVRTIYLNSNPSITITTPTNNTYYNSGFSLSITINETENISVSNYSIANTTGNVIQQNTNTSVNTTTFTWTDQVNLSNSTFPNGNYTLTVFANDTLGNSATSSVIFTVDKTSPNIINVSLHPSTVYNSDSITFRINVTDNYALNTSTVYFESNFSTNWTNYSMNNENNITFNFTLTGASNLSNQRNIAYKFNAQDRAGNTNTSVTYNFTVQNRIPFNLNIAAPTTGTVLEVGNSTSFNATATDSDSDTLTYYWNFSDNTAITSEQNTTHTFNSTGNFTIILNVSDGYSSNLTNITVIVNDTKPPTVSSLTYDTELHLQQDGSTLSVNGTTHDYLGIYNFTLNYNGTLFNGSCTSTNTTWNCNWSISSLTIGSYNFTLNYTDNFTTTHTNSSTYSFNVTSCSDSTQNGDETGTDCGGSCSACPSSGGGGGGGGGATVSGTTTYVISDTQLNAGYTNVLGKSDKMRFSIGSEEHYLTMESMTSVSAKFNLTSKVYQVLLSVGEAMKFELDNDNYYDVKVKLNGIDATAVKANLTVQKIHEAVPEPKVLAEEKAPENITTLNATNASSTSISAEVGVTPSQVSTALGEASQNLSGEGSASNGTEWKFIIVGVIVVALALFGVKRLRKRGKYTKPKKNAYPFP